MITKNHNVTDLIKDGIQDLDMTRISVAKHLGVSQQQFNNIINGSASVPVKYFHKLADILILDEETLRQAFIEDYRVSLDDTIKAWSKQ